ncbi:lasso peptide biosynthesis B2 protein [Roseateles sp.]|uniref:lasso peptide biosynthesis B2 protein n=1 Tax=Roseateles sp. TaxID=1971397 RepID=UPI003BAC5F28
MRATTASNPTYRLADHVRACRVGDQIVMLDLKNSRYIGLGGRMLSAWFPGIDAGSMKIGNPSSLLASESSEQVARLVSQGLLVNAPETIHARAALGEPLYSLNAEDEPGRAGLEWRHVFSVWVSAAIAAGWLRHRSLADIADRVACSRRGTPTSGDEVTEPLREAVAAYVRARPFGLTAHDRCLHDSLTLIRFLAARRLFPQWAIGVRTHPFSAHSWVQCGSVVLNDTHENVRRYQPLLVV